MGSGLMYKVFIGFDSRMPIAFGVANASLLEKCSKPFLLNVESLHLAKLHSQGLYWRQTKRDEKGHLFDVVSGAPMATEFAISRFLVPYLSNFNGWSLFCDSDFLFKEDILNVFEGLDPTKAVYCVHHKYEPKEKIKMDGQEQSIYGRKNWSSFMIFNCAHPANKFLTIENVNISTGRFLHGFGWLADDQIGELPEEWNWLEGHSNLSIAPKAVHFTRGTPDMAGYEDVPYADEWRYFAEGLPICRLGN